MHSTRYFRIQWSDADGVAHFSDPLTTWTSAEQYRIELNNPTAQIVRY
jgi:hypothetical protein